MRTGARRVGGLRVTYRRANLCPSCPSSTLQCRCPYSLWFNTPTPSHRCRILTRSGSISRPAAALATSVVRFGLLGDKVDGIPTATSFGPTTYGRSCGMRWVYQGDRKSQALLVLYPNPCTGLATLSSMYQIPDRATQRRQGPHTRTTRTYV